MAVLTTFKQTGDPDAIKKIAEETLMPAIRRAGGTEGRISSAVVRTETGVMLVNLWESEEAMRRAADRVGPIVRASGMPPQDEWHMYEVLAHTERHD